MRTSVQPVAILVLRQVLADGCRAADPALDPQTLRLSARQQLGCRIRAERRAKGYRIRAKQPASACGIRAKQPVCGYRFMAQNSALAARIAEALLNG